MTAPANDAGFYVLGSFACLLAFADEWRRRSRPMLAALVLLAAVSSAIAAAPKAVIAGPSERKAGQSILLDARQSQSDRPLRWKALGADRPFLTFDDGAREDVYLFLPDPEPGTYDFALVAIGEVAKELEADVAIHRVVVGGQLPPPAPIPGPGPTPAPIPIPTPGPLHMTLVFDLDNMDPAIAAIRTNPRIRAEAEKLNILLRSYDDDSAIVGQSRLTPYLKAAGGVPALVVQDANGKVLAAVPCPRTEAGVIALMHQFRSN